jgi:hypothetical protein
MLSYPNMKGEMKMARLFNWYIIDKGEYCIAYGNVIESEKFPDRLFIHTSRIQKVDVIEEMVSIYTKNSVYICELKNCCYDNQKNIDYLPVDLDILAEKYKIKYDVDTNSILLAFSDHEEYFFKKATLNKDNIEIDLSMYVHLGMVQDSCIIGDGTEGGLYDIRYFPNPGKLEFYTLDVENVPVILYNVGEKILHFQTEYGIIEVKPTEKKRLCGKNTTAFSQSI